ncbi:uncharacterized protein LOC121854458 [Homarus americanus]|uniref:uncharacterized protein LOC121854458 n=1 Tax=Homarus americanus TaxID=6706 RepID=UPI001C4890CD|nr:uncharacterized protein LOC121854458 [Homarus americanus]
MFALGRFADSEGSDLLNSSHKNLHDQSYKYYDQYQNQEALQLYPSEPQPPSAATVSWPQNQHSHDINETNQIGIQYGECVSQPFTTCQEGTAGSLLTDLSICDYTSIYPAQATDAESWPTIGPDQPMFPWPSDADHSPIGRNTRTPTDRKLKVYEWPPQSDPKLEKKRIRAIKAFNNRRRVSQQEDNLQKILNNLDNEISTLTVEKYKREHLVTQLEAQVDMLQREPTSMNLFLC